MDEVGPVTVVTVTRKKGSERRWTTEKGTTGVLIVGVQAEIARTEENVSAVGIGRIETDLQIEIDLLTRGTGQIVGTGPKEIEKIESKVPGKLRKIGDAPSARMRKIVEENGQRNGVGAVVVGVPVVLICSSRALIRRYRDCNC